MADWGWSGSNAPVGARLFGGGLAPQMPGTAASAARLAEIDRINRLYGVGPYAPQPSRAPLAQVPPASLADMYGLGPMPLTALPQEVAPPEELTRPAPASIPNGPSSTPVSPPMAPQESGRRPPPGTGMALAWRDFLGSLAASPWESTQADGVTRARMTPEAAAAATPPSPQGQVTAAGVPVPRVQSGEEPAPYMAPENFSSAPASPPPSPTSASPITEADALAGVTRGAAPYARLALTPPDYAGVMAQYDQSAPRLPQEGPNDGIMRLVASALAGGLGDNSPLGSLSAISGLAAGYAREGDRTLARGGREEALRREFARGRAELLGNQENSRWQTGLAQQTFDRASQQMGIQNALAQEELGIRRQNAGLSRTLTAMRINALARQSGMEIGPAEMLGRALPEMVRSSAPLMVQTEQGMSQLQLPIAPEYLRPERGGAAATGITMLAPADARRRVTETLMRLPGYAASPQALSRAVDGILSQSYMTAILTQPEPVRQQLLRQAHRWFENRPRANTSNIEDY